MVCAVVSDAAHTEDSGLKSKWDGAGPGLSQEAYGAQLAHGGAGPVAPAPAFPHRLVGSQRGQKVQLPNLYSFNSIAKTMSLGKPQTIFLLRASKERTVAGYLGRRC